MLSALRSRPCVIDFNAWVGITMAAGAGGLGAALLLAVFWRPAPRERVAKAQSGARSRTSGLT